MSAIAFDVDAVRSRFSALQSPTAFFDGPGGTQCPDTVIEAIAGYLRESNANLGGPFATSRRSDALLAHARLAAAAFLGCDPDEAIFGQNMTTLNFMLTRTLGRTLVAGDEILVTRLDHDGNVSPWLELAHDLDLQVGFVELHDDTTRRSRRSRAPPHRSHARRRVPAGIECGRHAHRRGGHRRARARRRRARLGRRSALRSARPDRRRASSTSTFCSARRTSSSGRISASRTVAATCSSRGARTRCARPTDAARQPLRDRHARARAARRVRRSGRLHRLDRLDGDPGARARARAAVPRAPARQRARLYGASDHRRPRADLRLHRRRAHARAPSPSISPSATSPSGTATTTRSR